MLYSYAPKLSSCSVMNVKSSPEKVRLQNFMSIIFWSQPGLVPLWIPNTIQKKWHRTVSRMIQYLYVIPSLPSPLVLSYPAKRLFSKKTKNIYTPAPHQRPTSLSDLVRIEFRRMSWNKSNSCIKFFGHNDQSSLTPEDVDTLLLCQ